MHLCVFVLKTPELAPPRCLHHPSPESQLISETHGHVAPPQTLFPLHAFPGLFCPMPLSSLGAAIPSHEAKVSNLLYPPSSSNALVYPQMFPAPLHLCLSFLSLRAWLKSSRLSLAKVTAALHCSQGTSVLLSSTSQANIKVAQGWVAGEPLRGRLSIPTGRELTSFSLMLCTQHKTKCVGWSFLCPDFLRKRRVLPSCPTTIIT